jgi:hypothetical protein
MRDGLVPHPIQEQSEDPLHHQRRNFIQCQDPKPVAVDAEPILTP